MKNPDYRADTSCSIADTVRNTWFRLCILCCSHKKYFLNWNTSFETSSLFHLSPDMTRVIPSDNTQLKLGHMFFLTHCYYACTVRVAVSSYHSVPCATSLRMHYNVMFQAGIRVTCNFQSFSCRTEWQVISREYLPLECSLHFAKPQSTMFGGNYRFFGLAKLSSANRLRIVVGNVVNVWFSLEEIIKLNYLCNVSFMKFHSLNGNEETNTT
jgi:hypothetical protein